MKWIKITVALKFLIVIITAGLSVSTISNAQSHSHDKHLQLMEILHDSVMMDLMMDHIASDNQRLKLMTEKMIYYAVGDTPKMNLICSTLLRDKTMRTMLVNYNIDTLVFQRKIQQERKEK